MKLAAILITACLACGSIDGHASPLAIALAPNATNPASPQMGDHLSFHSTIRNDGSTPVDGVIAWLSLVQTDQGKERPVDLEDWSAHKAITVPTLTPGQSIETDWPMRLIQAGRYRIIISAISGANTPLTASPFVDLTVREKPAVESNRVLPVALGLPALLAALLLWRWRRAST